MIKVVATGLIAAAIGGGVASELVVGGHSARRPAERARPHGRHYRDGPVHGLMLLPLADPDGHVPTASPDR